jgi:uncharacterized membrane protein YphA (DoxX/SURF4 family)
MHSIAAKCKFSLDAACAAFLEWYDASRKEEIMAHLSTASDFRAMRPSRTLRVALWLVQLLLALTFVGTGVWKLATPIETLAEAMPWMGQVTPNFLYLAAVADLAVGLGILLPSLLRIEPGLTVLSAYGGVVLMACAIAFHLFRGEPEATPFNVLLLALALFVAWGRGSKAPIEPRTASK